jgi:cytochrome c oxidase subunit II
MLFRAIPLILHFARPPLTRKALPVALRRWFRFSPVALGALTSLLLTGCNSKDPQDTFSPESPIARDIYNLAVPVFLIAAAMGIFVFALIFICAVKFRRKSEDHVPKQVHGNTAMEIGWTAAPALLLAVIGVFSVGAIFDQANDPKDSINITVAGHQWWWEFHYPVAGQEKLQTSLETVDNPLDLDAAKEAGRAPKKIANYLTEGTPVVVNANELHIPAGRNIRMTVTSQDVIHSFWIPKLAGKIDAVPGRLNHLNLNSDIDDAGKVFYAQCAEFCGASHADMRFKVHVDSPDDWAAWLEAQAGPAPEASGDPKTDLVAQGQALFQGGAGCVACHYTESDKVNDVGIVGKIGPNLAHVGSRTHFAGAIAELNDANLKAWLRDPQAFKPGSRMVVRKFTEDEVLALVAYIKSLK